MDQKPTVQPIKRNQRRFSRRTAHRVGGFTLIEILIVISIIVLLVGIGAVVGNKFVIEARKKQIKSMLDGLAGAGTEYAAVRKAALNHEGNYPIDWRAEGSDLSSSQRFVWACRKIKNAEDQMLAALNYDGGQAAREIFQDTDNDGEPDAIFDRWGTEIEYRSFNAGPQATGQGPERVDGSRIDNDLLPASKFPFFVSAGPDKVFGENDGVYDDITSLGN